MVRVGERNTIYEGQARILTVLSSDRALSSSRDVCPFEAVFIILPKLGVDTAVQADLVQGHAGAEKDKRIRGGMWLNQNLLFCQGVNPIHIALS